MRSTCQPEGRRGSKKPQRGRAAKPQCRKGNSAVIFEESLLHVDVFSFFVHFSLVSVNLSGIMRAARTCGLLCVVSGRESMPLGNLYGNKIRFNAELGHEEGLFKERSPPPPPVDPTQ